MRNKKLLLVKTFRVIFFIVASLFLGFTVYSFVNGGPIFNKIFEPAFMILCGLFVIIATLYIKEEQGN